MRLHMPWDLAAARATRVGLATPKLSHEALTDFGPRSSEVVRNVLRTEGIEEPKAPSLVNNSTLRLRSDTVKWQDVIPTRRPALSSAGQGAKLCCVLVTIIGRVSSIQ